MKNTINIRGVKIMRKVITILFFVALSIVLVHGYANATVTGTCSSCHTMHNSQGGSADTYDSDATPNEKLLKGGCIGCHAQDTSANVVSTIPQVLHSNASNLAGGNFDGVEANQANGHNVVGVGTIVADTANAYAPPGYVSAYDPASTDFAATTLVCAGQNGCHGDRDESNEFTAVSGAHHGDDSILQYGTNFTFTGQGATVIVSYRMLNGVKGAEDPDWQEDNDVNDDSLDHNGYYAKPYAGRTTQTATQTTSELCASCHGAFHMSGLTSDNGIGTASPWVRHPTDVLIPNSGEYASINTTYQDETPVGRPAAFFTAGLTAASSTNGVVAAGTDMVICLSCHRAHASDNADALRFSYTTQAAGVGCLHCHTNKDAF